MQPANKKESFQVMYIGGRRNDQFLKLGKIYTVYSVSDDGYHHTIYHFKELNGEFTDDGFVKVVKKEGPLSLISKNIPKVGERFCAFTGKLDSNGDSEVLTSSEIIFVAPQTIKDKLLRRVNVLTKHLISKGGCASLYRLYY